MDKKYMPLVKKFIEAIKFKDEYRLQSKKEEEKIKQILKPFVEASLKENQNIYTKIIQEKLNKINNYGYQDFKFENNLLWAKVITSGTKTQEVNSLKDYQNYLKIKIGERIRLVYVRNVIIDPERMMWLS
jgi:hypothetical protein